MKRIVVLSILNGFISAFSFVLIGDYIVSETFLRTDSSAKIAMGFSVLFPMLASIGYIFVAKGQSTGKIWAAFGIETASSMAFVFADLMLKTTGVPVNLFPVSPDDNPALGLLIIFDEVTFIVLSLLTHILTGIVLMTLSAHNKKHEGAV